MLPARTLAADALYRRADAIMLDYTQQGAAVRFLIDGLWQNGEPLDRETADPLLESLKILCGLNPMDRQNRQEGKFALTYSVFKPIVFQAIEGSKEEFRKQIGLQLSREFSGQFANPMELEQQVKLAAEQRTRERFASPIGTWTPVEKTDLAKMRGAEKINQENSLDTMKCIGTLTSQGTPTGERAILQLEIQKTRFTQLEELGMRQKMHELLDEVMHRERGLVLFSAPPANGLRTTMNVMLRCADRFMREYATVEAENLRYEAVENVPVTTYNPATGQTLAVVLPNVFHKEPNVLVVRDLVDAESTKMLLDQAIEERVIVSTVRARDSVEAICRLLALGVAPEDVAKAVTGVFCQRLVRKLCENCREAYAPPPQVLAQLGLPPGRVPAFYRPPQQREDVCPECAGMGYRGRTAVIEMLTVDETIRQLITARAQPDAIREAARRGGFRSMQEEGIVLVAKGTTSLPELIRVMKQQ
jgi:type II secretory ATPase GspE/PulE/Tfp pilus assembly ATPase PilB-like protein